MNNSPDIIILRGAPGAGKSQTAKSLTKYFPKGVRLEVDSIRQMVISVDWTNQKEHIKILHASTKLVLEFLRFGYKPVIVIDTFSGDKINGYLDTLYEQNEYLQIKLFALYTTDEELKRRLDLRGNTEFNDFLVCKKLNDDVLKWKNINEIQVSTTGISSTLTAEIIFGKMSSGMTKEQKED